MTNDVPPDENSIVLYFEAWAQAEKHLRDAGFWQHHKGCWLKGKTQDAQITTEGARVCVIISDEAAP